MTDVRTRTLASLTEDEVGAAALAAIVDGDRVVVLGRTPNGTAEVFRYGEILAYPLDAEAVLIEVPDLVTGVMAQALRHIDGQRRQALAAIDQRERAHRETLEQIRGYAIDKHRDGVICREGLNSFLGEFGMEEYDPRLRVDYTIRGNYEVNTTDEYDARTEAVRLGVDLSAIYDADTDTARHEVEVVEVQTIGD